MGDGQGSKHRTLSDGETKKGYGEKLEGTTESKLCEAQYRSSYRATHAVMSAYSDIGVHLLADFPHLNDDGRLELQ